jgi:hypothetical protein
MYSPYYIASLCIYAPYYTDFPHVYAPYYTDSPRTSHKLGFFSISKTLKLSSSIPQTYESFDASMSTYNESFNMNISSILSRDTLTHMTLSLLFILLQVASSYNQL